MLLCLIEINFCVFNYVYSGDRWCEVKRELVLPLCDVHVQIVLCFIDMFVVLCLL